MSIESSQINFNSPIYSAYKIEAEVKPKEPTFFEKICSCFSRKDADAITIEESPVQYNQLKDIETRFHDSISSLKQERSTLKNQLTVCKLTNPYLNILSFFDKDGWWYENIRISQTALDSTFAQKVEVMEGLNTQIADKKRDIKTAKVERLQARTRFLDDNNLELKETTNFLSKLFTKIFFLEKPEFSHTLSIRASKTTSEI